MQNNQFSLADLYSLASGQGTTGNGIGGNGNIVTGGGGNIFGNAGLGNSGTGAGSGGLDFGNILGSGTLNALGQGVGALGSLASTYFGSKQLGLAEDQFNTNRDLANRNLANQATTVNNTLENRYRASLAAKGGQGQESLDSYLARSKVDGSPV